MATPAHLVEAAYVRVHPLLLCFRQIPAVRANVDRSKSRHMPEKLAVVVDSHERALLFPLGVHQAIMG